jgi:hypothetical protein
MNEIEAYLKENFSKFRGGTLCMFGDWFSRPHDNLHQPRDFSLSDGVLKITFDENEVLTVWKPRNLRIDKSSFVIGDADHVRWEWFCYGRPKLRENLFHLDYVRTPDGIKASSGADWDSSELSTSEAEPAVRIE